MICLESECKFCKGQGMVSEELTYRTPQGEGVCANHAQLLFATGIQLDRINRNSIGTHRAMENNAILVLFQTGRPGAWTYDPKKHTRRERSH